jgi:hypothetical protein
MASAPFDLDRGRSSNLAAVIGPVQQSLTLTWSARWIARLAVSPDLRDVPSDCLPALDLACILVRHPSTHVVAAVPVEPATWIVGMNPTLFAPNGQRLAGIDTKEIQRAVAAGGRELGVREPARWKFISAIRHVLSAEHPECEHLFRRELRMKFRIEMASLRCRQDIAIAALHLIIDDYHLASSRHDLHGPNEMPIGRQSGLPRFESQRPPSQRPARP